MVTPTAPPDAHPARRTHVWRAGLELLSSMRFAIALLTIICIASVIGTVLPQRDPYGNYVDQFGPFWAEVFRTAGLYTVYGTWWFLLILAFLVISTSLCIARNAPKIVADLRTYKEYLREQSLLAFGLRAQGTLSEPPEAAARRAGQWLVKHGWKVRLAPRPTGEGEGWMVAARAGAFNKLGYLAAHSAIVLICLGGLLDGDLLVRAQMWLGGKTLYNGGGLISQIGPEHRLSTRNPAFRADLLVAEGTASSTAVLNQAGGVLLQELPFAIELKKFIVDYYASGMPKLFASDIVIHDRATGASVPMRVEVNHPASYRGVEIFQSSFDDGGSRVKLKAIPLHGGAQPFEVEGTIGSATELTEAQTGEKLTLEFTGLRVINVENFASQADIGNSSSDTLAALGKRLDAAASVVGKKTLRNVGPSINYKLRDAAGQAREFNNYMLPINMGDGSAPVFLLGVRETPNEPFRYLRIPADEQGRMDGFLRLRAALADPVLRARAVARYASEVIDVRKPELVAQLAQSAGRALNLFAGAEGKTAGLQAVVEFIEHNVPEAERQRAGEMLVRILNGVLFDLNQIARQEAGLAPLTPSEPTQAFMAQAVLSLGDAQLYPPPLAFELVDFTQVQASVFQVVRSPGKNVVYLGCALLVLGVFAMLYVRERRLWVWLAPQGSGSRAVMALSSNRKTLDGANEFEQIKTELLPPPPEQT